MPEVPENMQENLAHMEHQARSPDSSYNYQAPPHSQSAQRSQYTPRNYQDIQYDQCREDTTTGHSTQPYRQQSSSRNGFSAQFMPPEQPNFSPFPVLLNPPPNVPPTNEQKEAILEEAREAVLASNDAEVQLTWAQDALSYVEVAMQNKQRTAAAQLSRPQTPRVEHMLREDAIKIVSFLADQHHPRAEFMRGMWWEFGKFGYRVDRKEAFYCYTRAAERGYARAEYRIGMQFEQSSDALKAIRFYQRGVDAGDSASCYRLGMMTLLGQHGQPQDYERGLKLVFSAAQTADENAPQGAYVFGMLQARQLAQVSIPEKYLPTDINGARTNIEKAAYLGFAKAQVKMGAAYELCELGCDFSPALSLHYNALAARQGEPDAEMAISKWFLCGHEGVFEKNEEMAFIYAQRAAQSGLATAQFAMGYFNEIGIYVPVNLKEARDWYGKAASTGNKDAAGRIDSLSRSKTLSRKDHESVAISKIKKQYGSHGQSLTDVAPSVPSVPAAIDMPDPSKLSLNTNPWSNVPRPPLSAPYPSSGPERPPVPTAFGNHPNPFHRPNSAFGINPNLRSSSAAMVGTTRPDPYRQPGMQPQPRPYSSADVHGPGNLRSGRVPPGGAPNDVLQGRRYPSQAQPPLAIDGLPEQTGPPEPRAKLDIGFSAPIDPSGADRRQKLQKQNNPNSSRPLPAPPIKAGSSSPSRTSSRPAGAPSPFQPPLAGLSNNFRPATATTNNKPSTTSTKPATAATKLAATPAPAPARIPGKGPKTFEEMGVPQSKKESDCVIM